MQYKLIVSMMVLLTAMPSVLSTPTSTYCTPADDHDKIACLKKNDEGELDYANKETKRACMDYRNRANGAGDSKPFAVCDDCKPVSATKGDYTITACQSAGKHINAKQFKSYCVKYGAKEIREL